MHMMCITFPPHLMFVYFMHNIGTIFTSSLHALCMIFAWLGYLQDIRWLISWLHNTCTILAWIEIHWIRWWTFCHIETRFQLKHFISNSGMIFWWLFVIQLVCSRAGLKFYIEYITVILWSFFAIIGFKKTISICNRWHWLFEVFFSIFIWSWLFKFQTPSMVYIIWFAMKYLKLYYF